MKLTLVLLVALLGGCASRRPVLDVTIHSPTSLPFSLSALQGRKIYLSVTEPKREESLRREAAFIRPEGAGEQVIIGRRKAAAEILRDSLLAECPTCGPFVAWTEDPRRELWPLEGDFILCVKYAPQVDSKRERYGKQSGHPIDVRGGVTATITSKVQATYEIFDLKTGVLAWQGNSTKGVTFKETYAKQDEMAGYDWVDQVHGAAQALQGKWPDDKDVRSSSFDTTYPYPRAFDTDEILVNSFGALAKHLAKGPRPLKR